MNEQETQLIAFSSDLYAQNLNKIDLNSLKIT